MEKQRKTLLYIIDIALFTSLSFGATYLAIPFGVSKIHLGNFVCLLASLLLGPWIGGISGALGMSMNDIACGYPWTTFVRTFVLKFISEKESKYPGAQISTDISEAQAYAPGDVNDRVRKAVNDTRGLVLSANGELPYAWFHAHSGGVTELPVEGLSYEGGNPSYTQIVDSPDSDSAPTSVKHWEATFTAEEVAAAARATGVGIGDALNSIQMGKKSDSGRTVTFLINGREVSAPNLRVNLDSTRLKSTLLDQVTLENGKVTFKGRGYGHGVGMSQWGAYELAGEGRSAEEIVAYYFKDVAVARAW